jgi:hypothetical protein
MNDMRGIVQARLDEESQRKLAQLVNRLGLSPSEVVREGLRVLAACQLGNGRRRIIGQGQFDSGIKDLGSNKKHLKGFGR